MTGAYMASNNPKSMGLYMNINTQQGVKKSPGGITQGAVGPIIVLRVKNLIPFLSASPFAVYQAAEWVEPAMYLHSLWALRSYRDVVCLTIPFAGMLHSFFSVMIRDWDSLVFDVEHGTLHREVPPPQLSHAPMPSHASALRASASRVPPGMPGWVQNAFPRLNLIVSNVPNPALGYVSELERWFGDGIQFRELMYGASECIMALPPPSSTFKENKFRLLADAAFFEFMPVDEEEAKRCAGTGGAILPQEGVVGHIYEVVLTNFSGLWRYRIGDAIQLVGFEGQCPEIKFAYRVGSVLSIFGENINEIHLRKIMATVFGSNVVDFTFFQDDTVSRYHAYVELHSPLDTETVSTQILEFSHNVSGLSEKMDQAIRQTVYNYRLYPIKKPLVMIVKPGTFASLTSHIQMSTLSQAKIPPRVKNVAHIKLLNDNVIHVSG
ncbi:GH3 auxin-responsive promoter family protein [Pelomyxa schiedti]|nr:GH3 auxin-responsive promoter family protein [Pelomyxa schiedti]KAH3760058.1 GH3 auxin-responsive promoter family protein [Pelomyxa schiedti]